MSAYAIIDGNFVEHLTSHALNINIAYKTIANTREERLVEPSLASGKITLSIRDDESAVLNAGYFAKKSKERTILEVSLIYFQNRKYTTACYIESLERTGNYADVVNFTLNLTIIRNIIISGLFWEDTFILWNKANFNWEQ